jgi:hypothetical protein
VSYSAVRRGWIKAEWGASDNNRKAAGLNLLRRTARGEARSADRYPSMNRMYEVTIFFAATSTSYIKGTSAVFTP